MDVSVGSGGEHTGVSDAKTAGGGRLPASVLALSLCVATLIASEFMPVSLLTPISADLQVTDGVAGQAIAVSGIFAVVASLTISAVTRGIDRRRVLLALTALMIVSGMLVAAAPGAAVFMAGRALLGIVIGGFWSMSAAIVMRLVPPDTVPRALGALNAGNALATTIAAPLGSYAGQYIGWRGAFFLVVPLGLMTYAWLWNALPALPTHVDGRRQAQGSVFRVLRQPRVPVGMLAIALFFLGQFALFTYLRPFLEAEARFTATTLSVLLMLMGGAGVLGTMLIGRMVQRNIVAVLVTLPLVMAAIAVALTMTSAARVAVAALLIVWGLLGTAAPVGWWTWLSRTLPDDAEAGGGMMVAVIQLAIAVGASSGGVMYDAFGYRSTFLLAAGALTGSALLACIGTRATRAHIQRDGAADDR